jgi:hypothetical protein
MPLSAPAKDSRTPSLVPVLPPEERFWRRYSPHGEAPLSVAGSIGVHGLVIGGLILFALYVASLFYKPMHSLPIDPVQLTGGGDRSKEGVGNGRGDRGNGDTIGEPDKNPQIGEENAERRPSLNPVEISKLQKEFDDDSSRRIAESQTGRKLRQIDESLRNKLRAGLNPGKKPGPGTGPGQGDGPGVGPGRAKLTKREQRMLRWNMRFTALMGAEYLAQLRGLGAILAFPVSEGDKPKYKVVRDLKPGGKLLDEDLSKINRIYWFDNKAKSVKDILGVLGARLPRMPEHFVAFMPEALEKQLFDMERGYVERVLKRTFDEDKIEETQFRVVPTGRGYKPELISVTMR